jgi:acetyl-CoA acetyltransferase
VPTTLRKAVIAGIYQTQQARMLERTSVELYIEVIKGVLDDAGMTIEEIDGLIGPNPVGTYMPSTAFADFFGTHLRYVEQADAGSQTQGLAVLHAADAVAMGRADAIIVPTATGPRAPGMVQRYTLTGTDEWDAPLGLPHQAYYGMMARRHMYEYGTTSAQLAQVAVAARKHALLNPAAVMHTRGPITVDDVLGSPMIYDPLHLFDCCIVNYGGGGVLVTTEERARSLKHRPVHVLAYDESYAYIDLYRVPSITSSDGEITAKAAFGKAGVKHSDIDVAQLSDHFTINVIIELEDLGFCGKGEGGMFVESGAIELGGSIPINTDGGYLSHSHSASPGIHNIIELVRQLRGEAGARQVSNAKIGLYQGAGGEFNFALTAILARD